jgi:transposase InsO family protein
MSSISISNTYREKPIQFADALSRIYSDEPEGVVRADSEYVNDVDEPIRGRRIPTHPIYVDAALISVMSAEVRRSSRLAKKPELNYKETRDRKTKVEPEDESPTMVQEFPDRVESDDESDGTFVEDPPEKYTSLGPKDPENAARLFRTIGNQDDPFPDCLKGRYEEDPAFKPILDNPSNFTNFEIKEDLVFFRSEGVTRLAIPNVKVNDQSIREVVIRQGHSILAHLGGHKTLTYLRDQVWWKTMVQDVTDYCKSCPTCAASKSPTEKPRGLLKTMPVPTHPWQYIGIDFVGPLPESSNRNGAYDTICVIIDLLTAMVHLVPTKQTYKAADIAEVIFDTVYKLHGLPERIISDRDSLFTSHFWRKLHALLNVELRLSSAFHPQTDGATERANRTMTQMLRQCVGPKQKDWVTKLPAIEFAMNSARSSTTGFTPFYLNYGRNPSPMVWKGEEVYPGVRQFAENMKDAIMSAHDAIIASRVQHTVQANKKRLPASYQEGDLVYLSTKNISLPKGRARKLAPKYLGPFPITKVIKEGATYQLGLSDELIKRGVNRSFHASLLRPHVPNDDRRFPGRLPIQIPGFGEKPEEWIVDRIVTHHGKGMGSEFQILWKAGDKTWAPYREVAHLNALDRYCELMGVKDAFRAPSRTLLRTPLPPSIQ